MVLSNDLISQFVKVTNSEKTKKTDEVVYGTAAIYGNSVYVKLDGSDLLTPATTTTGVKDKERVMVMIKNHSAIITGNISSPSARTDDVAEIADTIASIEAVSIKDLEATNARVGNLEVDYGKFKDLTTEEIAADKASIKELEANSLSVTEADAKYANIDFSNIDQAAIKQFYATSGIIRDLVIGDQTITGKLVGITITGDLIEGNTVVADKLVIKGEDGLYYKLNTNGVTTEAEQTEYNSLNGSVIRAKSITAEKISVDDLVAFDATIAGFKITDTALYSGVKDSPANTTRGIYLGKDGQVAFGDANNFIKYYKDEDGTYKLAISADSLVFSTGNDSLEETINGIQKDINNLKDEISTLLRIESSRGTVFKNQ